MSYLETTQNVYKKAAETPDIGLCCTTSPVWQFPELAIPKIMLDMNYGCGSTVNMQDLVNNPQILYVGVGGGMELLQFSYFSRQKSGVIGLDVVDEMLTASRSNFKEAENLNAWFKSDYIDLRKGTALDLPIDDNSIDVAAQNCLFNIFTKEDLKVALKEMYRVLKPHCRLVMSDPVTDDTIPAHVQNDERLRALCMSGMLSLKEYITMISEAGFGTIEVRAKRPYRVLAPGHYEVDKLIYIESVEIAAIKDPMPTDGSCVFTGKSAIYHGSDPYFDDKAGHILMPNMPLAICDKTAGALAGLGRDDIYISESTYFYDGGGCC
jgi:SAM-dependent methyltransferase